MNCPNAPLSFCFGNGLFSSSEFCLFYFVCNITSFDHDHMLTQLLFLLSSALEREVPEPPIADELKLISEIDGPVTDLWSFSNHVETNIVPCNSVAEFCTCSNLRFFPPFYFAMCYFRDPLLFFNGKNMKLWKQKVYNSPAQIEVLWSETDLLFVELDSFNN